MALQEFQSSDFTGKKISELSNTPNIDGMSATTLKARFDAMTQQAVDLLNTRLIQALNSTTDGSSGADQISATTISGITGTVVQTILESLATAIATHTTNINTLVKSVTYNSTTGVFTITKFDDSTTTIDTPLEKVVTNFTYDQSTQCLILHYPDGSTVSIDLSAFIAETEFLDSSSITFTVSNHKVTANLSSSYYTTLEGFKTSAETASTNASTYATSASNSASTATTKANEASGYATNASNSATSASTSAGTATTKALISEGYAVGKQNGEDVGSTSPYYHNNAKYYASIAQPSNAMQKSDYDSDNTVLNAGGIKPYVESQVPTSSEKTSWNNKIDKGTSLTQSSSFVSRQTGNGLISERKHALLTKLMGNTVKLNQLVDNGNFASAWNSVGGTTSVSNNILTFASAGTATASYNNRIYKASNDCVASHKYLLHIELNSEITQFNVGWGTNTTGSGGGTIQTVTTTASTWTPCNAFMTTTAQCLSFACYPASVVMSANQEFKVRNYMMFDLTAMGIADDISTVDDFKEWLWDNLGLALDSYIAYTQGSLVDFKATGLKSTGKNMANVTSTSYSTQYAPALNSNFEWLPNTQYRISFIGAEGHKIYPNENLFISTGGIVCTGLRQSMTLTTLDNIKSQTTIFKNSTGNTVVPNFTDVQIEFGATTTDYVPYYAPTLPLPITTMTSSNTAIFPNGMLKAGNVYDECIIDEDGWVRKVVKRCDRVDLGSLTYTKYTLTEDTLFRSSAITGKKINSNLAVVGNLTCGRYITVASTNRVNLTISDTPDNYAYVDIINNSYTDASSFKTAMSGVYLNYELATPVTYTLDTPFYVGYNVNNSGMETIVPSDGSSSAISSSIKYMGNEDAFNQRASAFEQLVINQFNA